MYNNKLVASIKVNGRILRENKETVLIPFGSEYSFLIKNLHTIRALINVFIDGDNVVPGGLVLDAGKEIDLERYVRNGNLTEGNRFKFIERTAGIEQHRGVKLEDGLVRIEFQFERPPMRINDLPDWQKNQILNGISNGDFTISGAMGNSQYPGVTDKFSLTSSGRSTVNNISQMNVSGALRGVDLSANGSAMASAASASVAKYCADNGIKGNSFDLHDGMATMDSYNDAGITVAGSKSTQKFSTTYMGALEAEKHSIVLKLLGETPDNKPVLKPVTVKHKQKCDTCGHVNKATAQFCNKCGTSLTIFA